MIKKEKIKILHFISNLSVGGAEMALKKLVISKSNKKYFKYEVVSLTNFGKIGVELQESNIKVHAIRMNRFYNILFGSFRIIFIIIKFKPDIIHTWMYHADLIGGLLARLTRNKKIIWSIRNSEILQNNKGISRLTFWIMKTCAFFSKYIPLKIVSVSRRGKNYHISKGYDKNKLVVIPNGFNFKQIQANVKNVKSIRNQFDITDDSLIVGSIGRYNKYKDHENLILAANNIYARKNNIYFMIVGKGLDDKNKELVALINKTVYPENFILLGYTKDIPSILKTIDIFCLHSVSEGFPNVLGEAMSAGLPSVVTDVGDSKYILGNGGFVVPKKDSNALSEELLKLINMSHIDRKHIGDIARRRVEKKFSNDKNHLRYKELYFDVLD